MIKALAFLKKNHMAHRDIKPQNIICDEVDEKIEYRLIDFGVSKGEIENTVDFHTIIGTFSYMAPELKTSHVEGEQQIQLDFYKADAFSLGLVILTMGVPEFKPPNANQYNTKKFKESLNQSMQKFNEIYKKDWILCSSVGKMLRREPKERKDCKEIENDIELILIENDIELMGRIWNWRYLIIISLIWILLLNIKQLIH